MKVARTEDLVLVGYVGVLAIIVNVLVGNIGGPKIPFLAYLPNVRFYLFALIGYICAASSYLLIKYRPVDPTNFMLHSEPARRLWRAISVGLPPIIALAFFMPTFSLIKSSIPLFTEYSWDQTFIALDRSIHGEDPWRILQPILGHPMITSILAKAYHAWFLLIYAGSMFFAFCVEDKTLRYRYFFSYFVMWSIGGMAMAVGLASVGPCFMQPVFGDNYFADQMAYLNAANAVYPVDVLEVQQEILNWYETKNYGLGRGISAMPSMHVALAFMYFLAIRHVSRAAGWFFFVFFVIIQLASVHLAYHYAIDGYVSIALVGAVWWLSGKLVPMLLSRRENTSDEPGEFALEPAE